MRIGGPHVTPHPSGKLGSSERRLLRPVPRHVPRDHAARNGAGVRVLRWCTSGVGHRGWVSDGRSGTALASHSLALISVMLLAAVRFSPAGVSAHDPGNPHNHADDTEPPPNPIGSDAGFAITAVASSIGPGCGPLAPICGTASGYLTHRGVEQTRQPRHPGGDRSLRHRIEHEDATLARTSNLPGGVEAGDDQPPQRRFGSGHYRYRFARWQ